MNIITVGSLVLDIECNELFVVCSKIQSTFNPTDFILYLYSFTTGRRIPVYESDFNNEKIYRVIS